MFAVEQLTLGPLAGALVGWGGGTLLQRAAARGWVEPTFQRLASLPLALLAFALAEAVQGNGFIAAFFSGLTLGVRDRAVRERVQEFGEAVSEHYEIVIGDAAAVARSVKRQVKSLRRCRVELDESFSYAWELAVPEDLQRPFHPTHEAMAALRLERALPVHVLIAELRRAFSGIVAGNVKESGQRAVDEFGPFLLRGDPELVRELGVLLEGFVRDGRMKLDPSQYRPCFRLAS